MFNYYHQYHCYPRDVLTSWSLLSKSHLKNYYVAPSLQIGGNVNTSLDIDKMNFFGILLQKISDEHKLLMKCKERLVRKHTAIDRDNTTKHTGPIFI